MSALPQKQIFACDLGMSPKCQSRTFTSLPRPGRRFLPRSDQSFWPFPRPSRRGNGRILASGALTSRSCCAASLSSSLRTWRMAALHTSQSTPSSTSFPGLIRCPRGLALTFLRKAFRNVAQDARQPTVQSAVGSYPSRAHEDSLRCALRARDRCVASTWRIVPNSEQEGKPGEPAMRVIRKYLGFAGTDEH
jgi:hypothetical protein